MSSPTPTPPNPPFARNLSDGPGESLAPSLADTQPDSAIADHPDGGALLPASAAAKEQDTYAEKPSPAAAQRRNRTRIIVIAAAAVAVVVLAVILPVYFVVLKKHTSSPSDAASSASDSGSDAGGTTNGTGAGAATLVVTGGDGSTVTTDSGETFVYNNSFGGYWHHDPAAPFTNYARPNSWTPALNESWTWGTDHVNGVNLGGWFVLEPFIAPALFQAYPSARDEWSLSTLMRADGTLQATMEKHYDTFITEQDIAQIAAAGLNWVRVPIPFWAVSSWSDVGSDAFGTSETQTPVAEPFLEGICWKYIVRLLGWARKYGIRVNIDLHTIPGSQNGYNHSGKYGQINFLNGPMGVANAQRALEYIRVLAEFIAQPEWNEVVGMFGVVNEARMAIIGRDPLYQFYLQVHDMIRGITGFGAGKGPYISVHDGFMGVSKWADFFPGADRMILDTHPYFAFSGQPNTAPIATGTDPDTAGGQWPKQACNAWGSSINGSRLSFGVTVAGEWSNGYNDCGLYLNGVNGSHSYGGDCGFWEDTSQWDDSTKAGVKAFALASMDATQDWFFWTWKIGAAQDGVVRSPLWSYQHGLENGFMPLDPRDAKGACAARGVIGQQAPTTYSSWQTGGAGAGTIDSASRAAYTQWPPTSLANAGDVFPTYTPTGSVETLTYVTPTPTATPTQSIPTATQTPGNGWFDSADTAGAPAPVSGCSYPDAWNALDLPAPTAVC